MAQEKKIENKNIAATGKNGGDKQQSSVDGM